MIIGWTYWLMCRCFLPTASAIPSWLTWVGTWWSGSLKAKSARWTRILSLTVSFLRAARKTGLVYFAVQVNISNQPFPVGKVQTVWKHSKRLLGNKQPCFLDMRRLAQWWEDCSRLIESGGGNNPANSFWTMVRRKSSFFPLFVSKYFRLPSPSSHGSICPCCKRKEM